MSRAVEDMSRDDLENEVLWLRGELGLIVSSSEIAALCLAGVSVQIAKLVLTLYGAAPRVLPYTFLDDAIRLGSDGMSNIVATQAVRARRLLGPGSIQTVWGQGYRMTPVGVEAVQRLLGRAVAA